MRKLHSRIWRTRITEWPWVNTMLAAFQEENGLASLIGQLNDNIRDYGDQIERNLSTGLISSSCCWAFWASSELSRASSAVWPVYDADRSQRRQLLA